MRGKRSIGKALATVTLITAASAAAQTALEEMVVTARITDERLEDVPISVTAFGACELTDCGLRDVSKISQFTPGFSFERANRYGVQGGGSRPVIRGQSNILGEGNAAIFVDGILFTDSILSFPFDVVECVETIKGPQAALFGRATFSGAINLITKRAATTSSTRSARGPPNTTTTKSTSYREAPSSRTRPFYMVQGRWSDFGGQYRNRIDGRKVGQERSHGVNASLEFKMADDVIVRVSGGHGVDEDGIAAIALQDRFSNNCFLSAPFSITAARSKFRTAFNWTPPDCRALKGCTVIQRACSARSNTTATVSR